MVDLFVMSCFWQILFPLPNKTFLKPTTRRIPTPFWWYRLLWSKYPGRLMWIQGFLPSLLIDLLSWNKWHCLLAYCRFVDESTELLLPLATGHLRHTTSHTATYFFPLRLIIFSSFGQVSNPRYYYTFSNSLRLSTSFCHCVSPKITMPREPWV